MPTRVCTVRGFDSRGDPLTFHVEAGSVLEAAARGMEEIRKAGGQPSELEITQHVPKQAWKVSPDQLQKWVSQRNRDDSIGLQAIKNHLQEFFG